MDAETESTQLTTTKPLGQLGRDEMNLAEFPITLLTDRVPKDQTEAIYQDEIYDDRTGRTLTRRLTIKAGGYGLTKAADDEVILALIQLTRQKNNFNRRRVEFSRHELIRLLNWPNHGASYERILLSLQRWTSVYLQYENAWRDNKTKTWTSPKGFHIIDNFELNDSRNSGEQLDLLQSHIVWNEVIFESFQAGYLKPLDYDLCMGLKNSTAKRMYRFLDKRFYHKPDITLNLKEFAHSHVGLGRNYEGPAHLKRNLIPAIDELENIGFLEPLPRHERFLKEGKDWKIRLIQRSPSIGDHELLEPQIELQPPALLEKLISRGVTKATAAELLQRFDAKVIEQQIEYFDWMMEKKPERIGEPGGYLVDSVKKDYAAPKGYSSKADRQHKQEGIRTKAQQTAEDRRRKHQDKAREEAEKQIIDAEWKTLSDADLAILDADALAHTTDSLRSTYESMKRNGGGDGTLLLIRREHLKKQLEAKGNPPTSPKFTLEMD